MLDIGYKSILKVALPMMLSGFIQSIISITDAAFLGRYSNIAYDAAGSAGLWYITMQMVLIGFSDGAQIGMAKKIGARNTSGFTAVFQSNIILLTLSAVVLTLFIWNGMPYLMHVMVTNEELAKAELSFLEIRGYAFWASIIALSIQASYLAIGKTAVVLYAALIVAVSNVILDYFMVFGIGIFPRMGLEGAAIASTLAEIIGMLFLVSTVLFGGMKKEYQLFKAFKISLVQLKENVAIGFPLLLQGLVALSIWTIFFIWVEQMGTNELTVSLNIRYIYFLAFIPVWGFAGATKTYIAQYVGAKEFSKLKIIQRRIQFLCILFLVLTFHGAVLYPEILLRLVSNNEADIVESARILRIVSGSILIYGFGSVYFQSISGSGNTRITFLVECIATALYLTAAYLLIKVWKAPIHMVWLVEYVYFISMALLSLGYLTFFNWTKETKQNEY